MLKKLDFLVLGLAVILSLCPLLLLPGSGTAARVCITEHGKIIYEGALAEDARITTPDGKNIIEIKDGTARMIEADCADGLCLSTGSATAARPIVCLPNEVTVTILTEEEADYDVITQ